MWPGPLPAWMRGGPGRALARLAGRAAQRGAALGSWAKTERGQNGCRGRGYRRGHGRENSKGGEGGARRVPISTGVRDAACPFSTREGVGGGGGISWGSSMQGKTCRRGGVQAPRRTRGRGKSRKGEEGGGGGNTTSSMNACVRASAGAATQSHSRHSRLKTTETCPVSTEGWTRRVHFVRERGRGGGGLAPEDNRAVSHAERDKRREPARLSSRARAARGARARKELGDAAPCGGDEVRGGVLKTTRPVQLVRRDGRDVSTLYGREGGGGEVRGGVLRRGVDGKESAPLRGVPADAPKEEPRRERGPVARPRQRADQEDGALAHRRAAVGHARADKGLQRRLAQARLRPGPADARAPAPAPRAPLGSARAARAPLPGLRGGSSRASPPLAWPRGRRPAGRRAPGPEDNRDVSS